MLMIDPKARDVENELNELSFSLENFDEAMALAFQLYQNVYSRREVGSLSSWLIDQKSIQSDAYHAADLFVKEKGIRKLKLEELILSKCKELDALVAAKDV